MKNLTRLINFTVNSISCRWDENLNELNRLKMLSTRTIKQNRHLLKNSLFNSTINIINKSNQLSFQKILFAQEIYAFSHPVYITIMMIMIALQMAFFISFSISTTFYLKDFKIQRE
ncbi:hypothetical protein ACKWTF_000163 [Chironomus riparius]